jgi:hypothetical protein
MSEYHFIVTIDDMITGDSYTRVYKIISHKDYGAWSQCIARALSDLKGHENLNKIELTEVK